MKAFRKPVAFVGMETSGELRRRFAARGYVAISADLLPAEDGAPAPDFAAGTGGHIVGDVFEALDSLYGAGLWPSVAVFHPTCTYLTSSAEWAYSDPDFGRFPGVGYHQKVKPETLTGAARRAARAEALQHVRQLFALPIDVKVIENPRGAIGSKVRKASQTVQPYEHGDDASKATCLWFVGKDGEPLPFRIPVDPAKRVPGRMVPRAGGGMAERWANQTDAGQNRLSPGDDRWKDRSRTFPGIADALVDALTVGKMQMSLPHV